MAIPTPRVFTIPASTPFIPTLIEALLDGRLVPGFAPGRDPLALAGATLYLPTRRACRLARDRFLDVTRTSAAILPRIVPIGDPDEDEIAFAQAASPAAGSARPAARARRARTPAAAGPARPEMGRTDHAGRKGRGAADRQYARRGARSRRRPRPAHGRHGDTRGDVGIASTSWCPTTSTAIGS